MSLSNLIVPVLNRYDLLCEMFGSIDYPIDHLLVIDNGREMPEVDLPEFVQELTVLPMPHNLGVAASWNLGIKSFPFADRWVFTSADTVYLPGALEELSRADTEQITLAPEFPHWQTFALGRGAVAKLGLFDENLYPIYFEDNDYARRALRLGVETSYADIRVRHSNSSTIASNGSLALQNSHTFDKNRQYLESKIKSEDFSSGNWSLDIWRSNSWQL